MEKIQNLFSFKLRNKMMKIALTIVVIFAALTAGSPTLNAQVTLTPAANPGGFVPMGDSVAFTVQIFSGQALTNAVLKVQVPAGFKLLPSTPNLIAGTLNADTARILISSVSIGGTRVCTVYVRPLCDAATATPIAANRILNYTLLNNTGATLIAAATLPIQNFNTPILNVTYPLSAAVNLKTAYTRDFTLVQSHNLSHIRNIEIVASCDTSGFYITKVEVRRNNSVGTWIEIPVTKTATGYKYTLTQQTAFTAAQGYPTGKLSYADTIIVRETVSLQKCGQGITTYRHAYGDSANLCTPIDGNSLTYSEPDLAYTPDIFSTVTQPTAPSNNGNLRVGISNNSVSIDATMHDMYVNFYGVPWNYYKAWLCTSTGVLITGPGGATDTVWLFLSAPGTTSTHLRFDSCKNATYAAAYAAAGLSCLDGDGIYNDLEKGNTVYFILQHNFALTNPQSTCGQMTLYSGGTRRGDLYYKTFCKQSYSTYTRNYGAGSSTNIWTGRFTLNRIDDITVTPNPNLRTNIDEAQLNFDPHSNDNNCNNDIICGVEATTLAHLAVGASGYAKTSDMYMTIVLPLGMRFNASPSTVPVLHVGGSLNAATNMWTGGTNIQPSDYTVSASNDTIRIHLTATNYLLLLQSHIHVPIVNNGTVDNTKRMAVFLEYDYGSTGTYRRIGCPTNLVSYTQIQPCGSVELRSFEVERQSFGYTNTSRTTQVTTAAQARSLGFNLKVISPYDNVDLIGRATVNSSMFLATADIWVDISWMDAQKSMDTIAGRADAISIYYNNVAIPINISPSEISYTYTAANLQHRFRFNIAPALRGVLSTLNTNDSLRIVAHFRGTTAMPTTIKWIYPQMGTSTTISGSTEVCTPIMGDVQIFHNNFGNIAACSGGRTACAPNDFYHNATTWAAAFNNTISWSTGAPLAVWTGDEYRPNREQYSQLTVSYPMLLKINTVRERSGAGRGNMVEGRILDSAIEYTVTYAAGRTILTFLPGVVKDYMGTSSQAGLGYDINFDIINPGASTDNRIINMTNTYGFINYPTSAWPSMPNFARDTLTNYNASTQPNGGQTPYPYTYTLTPIPAAIFPLTSRAEWTLRVTNLSRFVGTDSRLPHSWLAVECPNGVTPVEVRDPVSGTPYPASFVQYATNRYWIKLDTVNANPTKDFILSCTYTACTGTPTLTVKYGMSKVDYPADPTGYANYNSPNIIKGVVSTNVNFTPPVIKFAGRLQHFPNRPGNTNEFCDTLTFEGEYCNGLSSTIGGLQLRMDLSSPELAGYQYYNAYTPQVKFGNGAWYNAQSASETGNVLLITLDDSKELAAYGAAANTDKAWVRFKMRLVCGLENNIQAPAQLIGHSGCGSPLTERVVSVAPIRIFGLQPPPDYWIYNLTLIQHPFTGGVNGDGKMTLTGYYQQAEPAVDSVYAIIDLPANVVLDTIIMPSLMFTQKGRRLIAPLPSTTGIGTKFDFKLVLRPINPQDWSMDSSYIYIRTGRENGLECDGPKCSLIELGARYDSVTVSMQKIEVRFSDSITAHSRYGDPSTERVVIDGWLVNDGDSTAGRLSIDLWYFNGVYYEPVSNVVSGLTVNSVLAHDSTAFRIVVNVPYLQDVCNMILVLRKNNTVVGSLNPYLADSSSIVVPVPIYEITTFPDLICQMNRTTIIGEPPIRDYRYQWNPTHSLAKSDVAQTTFMYDYETNPIYSDTTFPYLVSIIRPNGCISIDTLPVTMKRLPFVRQPKDTTLCSGQQYSITFVDTTNPLTTFSWVIENGPSVGMPAQGNSATINVAHVINPSMQPVVIPVRVTPKYNNCEGVTKMYFITINPRPQISYIVDQYHCAGDIVSPFTLGGTIPAALYRWERYGGTNIVGAQSGISIIPNYIANTVGTGNYRAWAEYDNADKICRSDTQTFDILVEALPQVNTVGDKHICYGNNLSVSFTGSSVGSYSWQKVSGSNIPGLSTNGTGNISVANIQNGTSNPITATYKVIPISSSNRCMGSADNFVITAYPPTILTSTRSAPPICSGQTFNYTATSTTNGISFTWRRLNNADIAEAPTTQNTAVINEPLTLNSGIVSSRQVRYEISMNQGGYCTRLDTVMVVVMPKPSLVTTATTPICSGQQFNYTASTAPAASVAWSRQDAAGIAQVPSQGNTSTISEVLTNITAAPILVTYQVDMNTANCSNTQNVRVTVNPQPILSSNLDPIVKCSGQPISYQAKTATSGANISWARAAIGGNGVASGITGTINETLTNTGIAPFTAKYVITTTYAACVTVDTLFVTVNPEVRISNLKLKDTICSGDYFEFHIESNVPGANFSWRRQAASGIQQGLTSGNIYDIYEQLTNTTANGVTVSYILRAEANGCLSRDTTLQVLVNPRPTAQIITPTPLNMLQTNVDTVTASLSTGATVVGWTSSNTGVATVTQLPGNRARIVAVGQGFATITLTIQDASNGCQNTVQFIVNVGATPQALLTLATGAASEVCSGTGTSLTLSLMGGASPFTVVYRRGTIYDTIKNVATSIYTFNVTPPVNGTNTQQTHTYELIEVKDGNSQLSQIQANSTVDVTVNPIAGLTSALSNKTICEGSVLSTIASFNNNLTSPHNTKVVYQWSNSNPSIGLGLNGIGNIASFIAANGQGSTITGTVTVTPYYRSQANCPGRDTSFTITVNPKPDFTVSPPNPICAGDSINLPALSNSIVQGITISGANTITFYDDKSASVVISGKVAPVSSRNYYVAVTTTDGCLSNVKDVPVTVNPLPVLSSSKSEIVCSGELFNYIATSPNTGVSYQWSRPANGQLSNPSGASGSGANVRETLSHTGNANVTVKYYFVMSANSCTSADSITVTVKPKPVLTNIPSTLTICSGDTFIYNTPTANVSATILWERTGVQSIIEPGSSGSGNIFETLTNLTAAPTTVTYMFTIYGDGCENTQLVRVVVNPKPQLSSALYLGSLCHNMPLSYYAHSTTAGSTFSWSRPAYLPDNPAGKSGSNGMINDTIRNTGSSPLEVKYALVTTYQGCVSHDTLVLRVNPEVNITSPVIDTICSEDYFNYTVTTNIPGANVSWRRSPNSDILQIPSQGAYPDIYEQLTNRSTAARTVVYTLRADADGCQATPAVLQVTINPLPKVTVISPTPMSLAITNIDTARVSTAARVTGWTSSNNSVATVLPLAGDSAAQITAVGEGICEVIISVQDTITGCYNFTKFIVNVAAMPTAVLSLANNAPSEVCSGNTTTLEVSISGGKSPYTVIYRHNGDDDTIVVATSVHRFAILPDTNTTVSAQIVEYELVSVVDAKNQSISVLPDRVRITVNPVVALNNVFPNPITACEGSIINTIPAFSTLTTPAVRVNYAWINSNPSIGLGSNGQGNISPFVARNGQGMIINSEVFVTPYYRGNTVTCEGLTDTIHIVVNPKPDFTVVHPDPICADTSFSFISHLSEVVQNEIPVGGMIGFYSNPAATVLAPDPVSPNITTTYYVRDTAPTALGGCLSDIKPIVLTVHSLPAISSSLSEEVCSGTPFVYTATSAFAGVSYQWSRPAAAGLASPATSGNGATIRETLLDTFPTPVNVEYRFKLLSSGCTGYDTLRVLLKPTPKLDNIPAVLSICSGDTFEYLNPTADVAGTFIQWERLDNYSIAQPSTSGVGSISEELTNMTHNPVIVSYLFTMSYNGCENTQTVRVTVYPTPTLSSSLYAGSICSGSKFVHRLRSHVPLDSIFWFEKPHAFLNGDPFEIIDNRSPLIELTRISISVNPVVDVYEVKMYANGCTNVEEVELTINPTPRLLNAVDTVEICSGTPYVFMLESSTANTTYSWLRLGNPKIVETPSYGSSSMISEVLHSRDTVPVLVKYRVLSNCSGCSSNPDTLHVLVHPLPAVSIVTPAVPLEMAITNTQLVTITKAVGSTVVWASSNPTVATVAVDALYDTIATVTAVSEGLAYINITVTDPVTGCDNQLVFMVNVGSENIAQLNLAPSYLPQVCNGGSTLFEFSVSGGHKPFTFEYSDGVTTYYDTANITPYHFMVTPASNTGTSIANHTYRLTLVKDGNNQALTITGKGVMVEVAPVAHLTNAATLSTQACEGTLVHIDAFATDVIPAARVRYYWENENPSIGLPLSGTGKLPVFQAQNGYGTDISAQVYVTPVFEGLVSCPGILDSVEITIHAKPDFTVIHPDPICNGASFDFTTEAPNIIQGVTPLGCTIDFFKERTCTTPATVESPTRTTTYYARVTSTDGCVGIVKEVTLPVNPVPVADAILDYEICNNGQVNIPFTGNLPGTVYHWAATGGINSNLALPVAGSGAIYIARLHNGTTSIQQQEITVTPEYTFGGVSCVGTAETFDIIVSPTPVLSSGDAFTNICSEGTVAYTPTSLTVGTVFYWERDYNVSIAEAPVNSTGAISEVLTNLSQSDATVRYKYVLDINGCTNEQYISGKVYPTPMLSSPLNAGKICSGDNFLYFASSAVKNTTFSWTRRTNANITDGGTGGSGTGALISETLINTGSAPQQVEYEITLTANSCSNVEVITVIVGPELGLSSNLTPPDICSGDYFVYTAASNASVRFTWEREFNLYVQPNYNSGNSAGIYERLVSTDNLGAQTVKYNITMTTTDGCQLTEQIVFDVYPLPAISVSESPVMIASGSSRIITITDADMINGSVGLSSSGIVSASYNPSTGDLSITALSVGYVEITYTTFNSNGCSNELIIPVTVTPGPLGTLAAAGQTNLCSSEAVELQITDILYGKAPWTVHINYAGALPTDEVVVVVNSVMDLPKMVTVPTPVNSTNSYFIKTYSITEIEDDEGSTRYSHVGRVAVNIAPVPTVNPITDQEICNGGLSTPVYFSGAATGFRWSASQAVGLAIVGEGLSIPQATVAHNQSAPVTATVDVYPVYAIGNTTCLGITPESFDVVVNPQPQVDMITDIVVCNGDNISIPITGAAASKFIFTTSTNVGMTSGTVVNAGGNLSFTAVNITESPLTATISVLPVYESGISAMECNGTASTFHVIVNPIPDLTPTQDMFFCAELQVPSRTFNGNTPGAVYLWQHIGGDTIVSLPTSGVNAMPAFVAYNTTDSIIHATYEVTASYTHNGVTCAVNKDTFVINVYPQPVVAPIAAFEYCALVTADSIVLGNAPLHVYDWKQVSGSNIGLTPAQGSGTVIPQFITQNTGFSQRTAVFEVTPRIVGTACKGDPINFSISVNPVALLSSQKYNDSICSGTFFDYEAQSVTSSVTFQWRRLPAAGLTNPIASNTSSRIHEKLSINVTTPVTVAYEIELNYNNCLHLDTIFTVVKPTPSITLDTAIYTTCQGNTVVNVTFTENTPGLPLSYMILFDNQAVSNGFVSMLHYVPVSIAGTIAVNVPDNLPAGRYSGMIYIEAGDCSATTGYPFVIYSVQRTTITQEPDSLIIMCPDFGSLAMEVKAIGSNLTYEWYKDGNPIPGATSARYEVNLPTANDYGNYYVIVDGDCATQTSRTVIVRTNEAVIQMKWEDVLLVSNVDSATGGNLQFASYQWYKMDKNGNFVPIRYKAREQYYQEKGGINGTYRVEVFYVNGKSFMSCPFEYFAPPVSQPLTLPYPNPVKSQEMIHFDLGEDIKAENLAKMTIEIIAANGQVVRTLIPNDRLIRVTMDVPAAVYILKVTFADGEFITHKIAVN